LAQESRKPTRDDAGRWWLARTKEQRRAGLPKIGARFWDSFHVRWDALDWSEQESILRELVERGELA